MISSVRTLVLIFSFILMNVVTSYRHNKNYLNESALKNFREALRIQSVCWSKGEYNKTALVLLKNHIVQSKKYCYDGIK